MDRPVTFAVLLGVGVIAWAAPAHAEDQAPPPSFRKLATASYSSPRLFQMPVADTVGPWIASVSYDGSLLVEPGVLSSAGVFAIGVGDIAQLEYRHTSAISVDRVAAPVPAIGVQLVLPLPANRYIPKLAAAFRLGVPREREFGDFTETETVTDVYLVGRLRLWGFADRMTLHLGARVSPARIEVSGNDGGAPVDLSVRRQLILPTAGWEWQVNQSARFVGEAGLVPRFVWDPGSPSVEPRVESGVQGRLGIRWAALGVVTLDASIGYQIEAASLGAPTNPDRGAVVDWDIRVGGELFIPWGAIACQSLGVFCQRGGRQ